MRTVNVIGVCVAWGVIVLSSFSVSAAPAKHWWNDEGLQKEINLSKEQQDSIEAIFKKSKKERNELKSNVSKLQLELNNMLVQSQMDEMKFKKTLNDLIACHSRQFEAMARMKLDVRRLLTKEQVEKILADDPTIFKLGKSWARYQKNTSSKPKKGKVTIIKKGEKGKN